MNDVVQVTRILRATPEVVFDAWTDADTLRRWLCPDPGVVVEASCDPVVGGGYRLVMLFDSGPFEVRGEYLEVDPPNRLVFTWLADSTPDQPSRVTVTLKPAGERTEMTIRHEQIPTRQFGESAEPAWRQALDKLDQALADVGA